MAFHIPATTTTARRQEPHDDRRGGAEAETLDASEVSLLTKRLSLSRAEPSQTASHVSSQHVRPGSCHG